MGRVKATDDYSEAVKKFENGYQESIAELDRRYLARLARIITDPKFVQYGLIAAFMSVVIVGMFSLRVH
jgi:hypothetical protein